MADAPARVGFVGLGNMGLPMAGRLRGAGFEVVGFDLSEPARQRAEEHGIPTAARLEEAARGVSLFVLMLPDSEAVEAVLGDEALLSRLLSGTLVVDMSSSEPGRTRALASALSGRGLAMLDAPVSGGVSGAEAGTLTIMVGGEAADLERARPVLEALGRPVLAGPAGAGHAVKALNNLLSATHLWVTSEAMLAGMRFGIDPATMLAIFNQSSGRSGSTEAKWPRFVLPRTFDSGFGIRLMVKDMKIGVALASEAGVPNDLGAAAAALWEQAAEGLAPAADHTEVVRWLEDHRAAPGPGGP